MAAILATGRASRRAVAMTVSAMAYRAGGGAPLGGPQFGRALPHWVTALTYHTGPYSLPAPLSRTAPKGMHRFLPLCTIP
jgi:hypothetical protein